MTIDINKAIAAAAMEIFDRISESRRSAGNTFWQSEAVTIISSRITPVVEAMENIIEDLAGTNKYLSGELAKLETELAELKALGREYQDKMQLKHQMY